jgi:hypothetical protein
LKKPAKIINRSFAFVTHTTSIFKQKINTCGI